MDRNNLFIFLKKKIKLKYISLLLYLRAGRIRDAKRRLRYPRRALWKRQSGHEIFGAVQHQNASIWLAIPQKKKCQVPPVGLAAVNKVTDFSAPVNTFLFFLSEIFLNFTVGPLLGDPKKSFLTSTVRRRNKWAGRPFASAPSTKPPNFDLLRREGAKHPQADGWHFESFTATETPRSGEVRLRASSSSSSPPSENIKKIALMTPRAQVHYGHPLRPPPLFF